MLLQIATASRRKLLGQAVHLWQDIYTRAAAREEYRTESTGLAG
jgi:hypothetical protein